MCSWPCKPWHDASNEYFYSVGDASVGVRNGVGRVRSEEMGPGAHVARTRAEQRKNGEIVKMAAMKDSMFEGTGWIHWCFKFSIHKEELRVCIFTYGNVRLSSFLKFRCCWTSSCRSSSAKATRSWFSAKWWKCWTYWKSTATPNSTTWKGWTVTSKFLFWIVYHSLQPIEFFTCHVLVPSNSTALTCCSDTYYIRACGWQRPSQGHGPFQWRRPGELRVFAEHSSGGGGDQPSGRRHLHHFRQVMQCMQAHM